MSKDPWIWLDSKLYPDHQTTYYNTLHKPFTEQQNGHYTVAEFQKEYTFGKSIKKVLLRFSGDTEFRLACNDRLIATGPANVGGDFYGNEQLRPRHYATLAELTPGGNTLRFYARVKMMPVGINEYSHGHGGFMLSGTLVFEDGTTGTIRTDRSWLARKNSCYTVPDTYDQTRTPDPYFPAEEIPDIWNCTDSPLKPRMEFCPESRTVNVAPNSRENFDFSFDKIYAGFITLSVKTKGLLSIDVECLETDQVNAKETFLFHADSTYIGLQLRSIGRYRLAVCSNSGSDAEVTLSVTATCYPADNCAKTVTSDDGLNQVLRTCEHTLKYCRQMIHLDSPLHSEPLACTGDYYIEMLMTAFSYGDLTLAEFDIIRTAETLRLQNGIMFHTTYSMIWILMLYDAYLYTGDRKLLTDCADALKLLLDRFKTYLGENGLIETPPSYMFIDWLYVDEISLHHPPKALGQSCLNLFYYGGLTTAARIYTVIGEETLAEQCRIHAAELKKSINELLYDREKELFFEGLNTPTPNELLGYYMPQNVSRRYYRIHANILAVYFDAFDGDKAALLTRTLENEELGEYQPYFAHFVLEAVRRCGLSARYLLPILEKWKDSLRECTKGLAEGFIAPEPGYQFDHSHAWGGTPLYAFPVALLGLEILEPGLGRIRLHPDLLGLSHAVAELPTKYGMVRLEMEKGKEPILSAPSEITVLL